MRIVQFVIKVDDLQTDGEFYEKVFGLRDIRQGHNRDHYSRHMTNGNIKIVLLKYDNEKESQEDRTSRLGPGIHHFGFEVANVENFKSMVEQHELEVVSAPRVPPVKFRLPVGRIAEFSSTGNFAI